MERERQKRFQKGRKWQYNEANLRDKQKADVNNWQAGLSTLTKEEKKKHRRTKNLVTVGEISKAMSVISSNGVAEVDSEVLDQLKAKHPSRTAAVHFPSKEQTMADGELQLGGDIKK